MTILDSYCLVALVLDEPAASDVQEILRAGSTAIPAVNLAEVIDVLERRENKSESDVRSTLAPLLARAVDVVPVAAEAAWRAAALRSAYYRRDERELSLADCILLACTGREDTVATADPGVIAVARAEGIDVIPLPDSRG